MRARLWFALLVVLIPLAKGLPAQEIQVPVDEAGKIQLIDASLARRLGLFDEVEAFREARLFRVPDGSFVLEITSGPGGGLRRERRPLSAAQAADFRRDVTTRVMAQAPTAVLDQSGRLKLLGGSLLLGLGYYGWATAVAFDPDDSQTAVAIYMLTAAGTFFLPYLVTQRSAVPDAVATLSLWGAMRGPVHGVLTSELGDAREDKTKFGWSVALGAAEGVAGGLAAQALNLTSGRAELTGVGGDVGLGVGFAVSDLLSLDERFKTVTFPDPSGGSISFQERDRTLQSLTMLAGSGLGLVGGYLLGGTEEWTRGDAIVFRNVTLIGAVTGLALGDIIQQPKLVTFVSPDGSSFSEYQDGFSKTHSAGSLIGTAAGVVLGQRLVTGRNFTTGQGTLLSLTPLAGALVGLGLAYVATPERSYIYNPGEPYRDPNDHSELYLSAAAAGGAIGFAALYPSLAKQAKGQATESNLQLSLNPLAAAQMLGGSRGRIPLGFITYRF